MRLVGSLLVFAAAASVAWADDLLTLDNKIITGTLVGVNDKEVAIKQADGSTVKTTLENVIALNLRTVKGVPFGETYSDIRLIDDTTLLCKSFTIKGKKVEITLRSGQTVTVPLASVVSILRGAQDAKVKNAWDKLDKVKYDRVVLYQDGSFNTLEGTLGEADADGTTIKFTTGGATIPTKISNLRGLIFYRPEAPPVNPVCIIYDLEGTALAATKVSLTEAGKLAIVTTIPDVTVTLDKERVAKFDYNMGKLTFLSDLEPSKVMEKSAAGLIVAHQKNANLDGDPIIFEGKEYKKGLSMHAHTEVEYDLKGKYKTFTAVVGVDPRTGADSQAKLTIEVDGRTKYSEVYTVKRLETIKLDITGATTIRFIVTSRNFLDLYDHVTLANPKVTQ
jgi:hypothetical protein